MIDSSYVLVQWPESQDYMMEPWFQEEAILALGSEDKTGSSAYFIPMKRYLEVSSFKKNEIQSLRKNKALQPGKRRAKRPDRGNGQNRGRNPQSNSGSADRRTARCRKGKGLHPQQTRNVDYR